MQNRLGLIGAGGRLAKAIAELAPPDFIIAQKISRANPADLYATDFDLYIDVSAPDALAANLAAATATLRPIVIGVTGIDRYLLKAAAKKIPVFYAPNFSLGMTILRKLAALTAKLMPEAKIDIAETHHVHKKDAPSGSAIALAATVGKNIPIRSIRLGETVGEHELSFCTPDEKISLKHTAERREVFAAGALAAARFLARQKPGLYGMDDLFNI